jgi:hypothetical protein
VSDPYHWNSDNTNPTSPTTPTLGTPSPSLSPSINGSSPSTSTSAYSPASFSSLHLTSGICTPLDPSQVQSQQQQYQQQQQPSYSHVMLMPTYSMVQQQQTVTSPVSDDTIPNTATTHSTATANHFKRFSVPLLSMNSGNCNNINNAHSMSGDADAAATGPAWDTNNGKAISKFMTYMSCPLLFLFLFSFLSSPFQKICTAWTFFFCLYASYFRVLFLSFNLS